MNKLTSLWYLYKHYKHQYSLIETCHAIFVTCAGSEDEYNHMTLLFKEIFRPKCYSLSILKINSKNENLNNVYNSKQINSVNVHPYSLCDSVLDHNMFIEILGQCPEILEEFGYQMNNRIFECYGDNK